MLRLARVVREDLRDPERGREIRRERQHERGKVTFLPLLRLREPLGIPRS